MGSLDKFKPVHAPPTDEGRSQNSEHHLKRPREELTDFMRERPRDLQKRINWWKKTGVSFIDKERYVDGAGEMRDEPSFLAHIERLAEWIPEADIERTMRKVQDIDEHGTAYHVLNPEGNKDFWEHAKELDSFLSRGIVPKFYPDLRTTMRGVGFNVIGWSERYSDRHEAEERRQEGLREIGYTGWLGKGRIAILFDISPFKEAQPGPEYYSGKNPGLPGTFRVPSEGKQLYEELPREDNSNLDIQPGKPKTSYGFGFQLFGEVSPKLFRGIVISPFEGNHHHAPQSEKSPAKNPADVRRQTLHVLATMLEIYTDKKINELAEERGIPSRTPKSGTEMSHECLLPIYDPYGNLLWPKQMSYAEVKQYVAERKAEGIS